MEEFDEEQQVDSSNNKDLNSYEILNTIDRLILFKTNLQIENGISEIQSFIESENGK